MALLCAFLLNRRPLPMWCPWFRTSPQRRLLQFQFRSSPPWRHPLDRPRSSYRLPRKQRNNGLREGSKPPEEGRLRRYNCHWFSPSAMPSPYAYAFCVCRLPLIFYICLRLLYSFAVCLLYLLLQFAFCNFPMLYAFYDLPFTVRLLLLPRCDQNSVFQE